MSMADLDHWLGDVERFADAAATIGAESLSEAVDEALRAATGGDGALSHRRGGAATVRTDAQGRQAEVAADGDMGVWAIIENGTSGHQTRAYAGSALATPYGPKSMVTVAGMAANNTWSNGVDDGMVRVAETLDTEWGKLG
jgi:hypothetical protein